MAQEPSKMHAVKDKIIGGVKETLGTVTHAETLKESGREQKREGDAEAMAAGKGNKHYDPALARKGVGIQHKHLGPNPKKHTEGPCAGCTAGSCQVGHDYDAALCHSVTQGHCEAGHVKDAGLGHDPKVIHGDGQHATKVTGAPLDVHAAGHPVTDARYVSTTTTPGTMEHHQNIASHHHGVVPAGHNVAYDAALCEHCATSGDQVSGHSKKDKKLVEAVAEKKHQAEKAEIKQEKKELKEKHKDKMDHKDKKEKVEKKHKEEDIGHGETLVTDKTKIKKNH